MARMASLFMALWFCAALAAHAAPDVDDTPAGPGEWGFRPAEGERLQVTPPGFAWRLQEGASGYEVQCSRRDDFSHVDYWERHIGMNVHTPPEVFEPGEWHWRFRYRARGGTMSEWSRVRSFEIGEGANRLPLPSRDDLLARVPDAHPRLFVRPEQIPGLRERAKTDLRGSFEDLVAECERILNDPPDTTEPPLYPEDMERKSEAWREMWWGNRVYTIRALDSAATLAFTHLLGGREEYAELAKSILMDCAEWNPRGSTGYRYNDEAGMPYNYYFSRTYTFLNDQLDEAERERCRTVMRVRGREMHEHLYPRHLWRPYASHSNRAWHFLGEVGIAFKDEIPEADEWIWFAANVFTNVYPVWSDADGGWHEGVSYWRSYIGRFTWWADVMRAALGVDAFDKPYFSQVGYYPMYLQPPGTEGGGFGDLCADKDSRGNCALMAIFAAQAQNPHWQWYVEAHGYKPSADGYIGFLRGALPAVEAKPPTDLPTSRLFEGTGQAMLNRNLLDANDNVEIVFKSSPFGTQSHGYESNNSFLLYAFGERLFIRTGRRDIYGSDHHQNWMWETKSTNCVTVNGRGQKKHAADSQGEIVEFRAGTVIDYVAGEAADAYEGRLDRFTRRVLFIKPDAVVIHDVLRAPEPSTFEWHLHTPRPMKAENQHAILARTGVAACDVDFVHPAGLVLSVTNQFDPPPRERIQLTEYHLTAKTGSPSRTQEFVTLFRPRKYADPPADGASMVQLGNGRALEIPMGDGKAVVLLQAEAGETLSLGGVSSNAALSAAVFGPDGGLIETFANGGGEVQTDTAAVPEGNAHE